MQDNNPQFILACDIGGTHITCSVVEHGTWTIFEDTLSRSLVNSGETAKTIFQSWTHAILDSLSKFDKPVQHIGIAMPGPFDYENGISLMNGQSKYDSIYKLSTTEGLLTELNGAYELLYINDAAAFLQGEVFANDLTSHHKILGITLGTGLGSAVWEQGQKAFDADLWDSPYNGSIFEEHLVTRWFVRRFKELTGIEEKGLKEIIQHHAEDESVVVLLTEYSHHLENFLDFFSEKYDCKEFIIGGNIARAWDKILQYNTSLNEKYSLILGKYEEKAAMIGAASLF
ncbi:ROK family protein [Sphingobacterium hungaricum]|uniref:ROK family protein n=1 Tax=Sphingobacterium hungaricum TaxID=2082723 RepID=A0A928YRW1_9SPHI|nr:ROK family protein [Sphingobacterium hungaricum]MBE8715379.1 ROK family protein [Sphingobacterium hungaricum]